MQATQNAGAQFLPAVIVMVYCLLALVWDYCNRTEINVALTSMYKPFEIVRRQRVVQRHSGNGVQWV